MTDLAIIETNNNAVIVNGSPVDLAIGAWLDAKSKHSGSAKTSKAYRDTLTDFRATLRDKGLDLDSDPRPIRVIAQAWAGASKVGRDVTATTYNQRLAVVSSFYIFANRAELLTGVNPIEKVDRRKVQEYGSAAPLNASDVKRKLAAIDRTITDGKRDYALLSVALSTGRRVAELAALRKGDMTLADGRLTLEFKHAKGGKQMIDRLSKATSSARLDYLMAACGNDFMNRPADAPVWISSSDRNNGKAISGQTIADICERRLGTSKVHTLRHTFAHSMEQAGAKVSDIQARLGHESLATTGRYLASLSRADNPYADDLAELFGI